MKNLVSRLDFLEARLSQINEENRKSKLFKTKFVVKKTSKPASVDEINAELADLKKQLADRKVYGCIKQMGRCIKQFKALEPQKIKKRLADSPKREVLEQELQVVENLDIDDWASYVSKAQLAKNFGEQVPFVAPFEKRQMSLAENNVYGRLCKVAAVKQTVEAAVKAIGDWYARENDGKKEKEEVDAKAKEEPKKEPKESKEPKAKEAKVKEPKEPKAKEPKAKKESKKEVKAQEPEEDSEPSSPGSDADAMVDDFFLTSEGSALPTLNHGYISGSEDESEPEEIKPERKNRRGQRARRAMWEKKYGAAAKHVAREREQQQKEAREKERKREFRVQKDRQRQEAQRQREERKKALEAKPIHPSWAAKQQQEKLKSVKPAGKKIVFE